MNLDALITAHGVGGGTGYKPGQKIHVAKLGLNGAQPFLKVDDFLNGQWGIMAARHKNGYVYTVESVSGIGIVARKYADTNLKSPIWTYTYGATYTTSPSTYACVDVSDNGSYVAVCYNSGNVAILNGADGSLNRSCTGVTSIYTITCCNSGDVWFAEASGTTFYLIKCPVGSSTPITIGSSSNVHYALPIADEANQCIYVAPNNGSAIYKLPMSASAGATFGTFVASLSSSGIPTAFCLSSTSLYVGTNNGWVYKFTTATGAQVWGVQAITTTNGWKTTGVSIGIYGWLNGAPGMGLELNETGLWISDNMGLGKISCVDGSTILAISQLQDYVAGNYYTGIMPIQQPDGHYNVAVAVVNLATNNPNPSRQPVFSDWVKILP